MTVSDIANKISYTGDGTTSTYSFPFGIDTRNDLFVFVKNANESNVQTLNYQTDYTVSISATEGGSITLTSPLQAGKKILIVRALPNTQNTDVTNNGPYYQETVENALDRVVMIIQDKDEELGRILKLPSTIDDSFSRNLPEDLSTANKILGVNSTGTALEMKDIGDTSIEPEEDGILYKLGNDFVSADIVGSSTIEISKNTTTNPVRYGISIPINVALPGTEAILLPKGTTAQRPRFPLPGMQRFNVTTNRFEGYRNSNELIEFLDPSNPNFTGAGWLKLPSIAAESITSPAPGNLFYDPTTYTTINGTTYPRGVSYGVTDGVKRLGAYLVTPPLTLLYSGALTATSNLETLDVSGLTTVSIAPGATNTTTFSLGGSKLIPMVIAQVYLTRVDTNVDSSIHISIGGGKITGTLLSVGAKLISGTTVQQYCSSAVFLSSPTDTVMSSIEVAVTNNSSSSTIVLAGYRIELYSIG